MKKTPFTIFIPVIILGFSIGGILAWQKAQWVPLKIDEINLSLFVHKSFKPSNLSTEDKESKVLVRINRVEEPPFLITLRYEDGLRLVTSLTRQDLIPMLLGNIDKVYPQRFTDYKSLSTRQFEQDGHKAAEIIFTYDGPAGEKVKQKFLIVDIDGNQVLYIAAQVKEVDFDQVNKRYFDRIFQSLTFD
jgi:hypothetical protein